MIDPARTASRLETHAPWVAGLLLALPVLVARYPPMTDLPLHEAVIGALRYFDDATMMPPGLYVRNLGHPNQLFHVIAWLLSHVVATDVAVKLVVAGAVMAIPMAAARLASHVGASRLSALVMAPIAVGWLFSWGLVANLIGLACLLALLPTLDRLADAPTARRAAWAVAGVVLLYFAHEAMLIVYAGAALFLAACHRIKLRETALRLSPLLAAGVMVFVQARLQERLKSAHVKHIATIFWPLSFKLKQIPGMIFQTNERVVQWLFFGLVVLAIALLLVFRHRERASTGSDVAEAPAAAKRDVRAWVIRHRFEVLAAGLMLAYFAFPATLNGATLVHQRFFAPAFGMFVVVAAPRDLGVRPARLVRLLALVLPVATLLIVWPSFADSDREYRDLDPVLARIPLGSAVMMLDFGPYPPGREYNPGPASARALATRGGRVLYSFTDSPVAPVMVRPEYRWDEVIMRVATNSFAMRPSHDLKRFRYVILRTGNPVVAFAAPLAMLPEAKLLMVSGEWFLFESTLPQEPLLSPDAPKPDKSVPTLRRRMAQALERELERNAGAGAPPGNLEFENEAPGDPSVVPGAPGHL